MSIRARLERLEKKSRAVDPIRSLSDETLDALISARMADLSESPDTTEEVRAAISEILAAIDAGQQLPSTAIATITKAREGNP